MGIKAQSDRQIGITVRGSKNFSLSQVVLSRLETLSWPYTQWMDLMLYLVSFLDVYFYGIQPQIVFDYTNGCVIRMHLSTSHANTSWA